ncbi:hypothetical protein ACFL54_06900 [Planctomycetota bacterium]
MYHIRRIIRDNPGMVLLTVLSFLALMALVVTSAMTLIRLERIISRNYLDLCRAKMGAESGIEKAIAKIKAFPAGVIPAKTLQAMTLVPGEAATGLAFSDWPSFAVADQVPSGRRVSGVLSSSYSNNGDYYILQVEDATGKLNLNDPDEPFAPGDDNSPGRLRQILQCLCHELFHESLGTKAGGKLANLLMDRRRKLGGRFNNYEEIREAVLKTSFHPDGILDVNQYRQLLEHVTLFSWVDPDVLRPNFQPVISTPAGGSSPQYNPDGSIDVYLYSDAQTKGLLLEPRAPVNINTASVELLTSLISPVRGWFLEEGPLETLTGTGHYGHWNFSFLRNTAFVHEYYSLSDPADDESLVKDFKKSWDSSSIAAHKAGNGPFTSKQMICGRLRKTPLLTSARPLAKIIYQRVHKNDNPFKSWDEFRYFLEHEIPPGLLPGPEQFGAGHAMADEDYYRKYYYQVMVDCLLANFNPNANLNDFNPDRSNYQHVDKAQLCGYSTEFCFEPTGCFEIKSMGVVENPEGRVLASSRVAAGVKMFAYFRLSTQAQFLNTFDTPGDLENFFSASDGIMPTSGNWIQDYGFTLQSYPEPVLPGKNLIRGSIFDGAIALAGFVPQYRDPEFGANFESGFKPHIYGRQPDARILWDTDSMLEDRESPAFVRIIRRTEEGLSNELTVPGNHLNATSLTYPFKARKPGEPLPMSGSLHPDGALSDAGRSLAYRAANIGCYPDPRGRNFTGTVHFWIKPNFFPELSTRIRKFFSIGPRDNWHGTASQHEFSAMYFGNGTWNNETGEPEWRSFHPLFYGSNLGNSFLSNAHDWIPPCALGFGYGHSRSDLPRTYDQIVGAQISETIVADFPGKKHPPIPASL